MKLAKHFRNELGHDIDIQVEKRELAGVDGILISIAGPDSDTDVHITKVEAQVLYETLASVLGWKR